MKITLIAIFLLATITAQAKYESKFANVNGTRIHYLKAGTGTKALVLIHGFGDTSLMWTPLFDEFGKDYTIIAPDLRGLGESSLEKTGYDKKTAATDVHELAKRGIVGNVVGFDTFYSAENPPNRIIDAVAEGRVGVAIVWGPAAGYFVGRQSVPLEVVPIPSGKTDLPFAFDISMGVRPGDTMLKAQLEKALDRKQSEIQKILKDYGVPLLDRATGKAVPK